MKHLESCSDNVVEIVNPVHWPPRSPHEALLQSPNGRKRLQDQLRCNSVSPSPVKRRKYEDTVTAGIGVDEDDEEEEDEETLQLQLKAIEARLKLKKLQKAKAAALALTDNVVSKDNSSSTTSNAKIATSKPASTERPRTPEPFESRRDFTIQVAHSPKTQAAPPIPPESPRRVLLGIDKGVRAADVSLKRAKPVTSGTQPKDTTSHAITSTSKPRTFNERLADARSDDLKRQQKHDKQARTRSTGFGMNQPIEQQENIPSSSKAESKATSSGLTDIEEHSSIALSRRIMSASSLTSALQDKDVYNLPRLLRDVHAPDYDPPEGHPSTADYVLLAIIASKSQPKDTISKVQSTDPADPASGPQTSKFSVLHLTDLEWTIDLFLFDTGFTRFRKLTVGSVVAILNPLIMPPKAHKRDTGQFALKLASSEDTVLEIGMAKDLGFCKSIKKDGAECAAWIDKRKTEFCDFHVNLALSRAKNSRAEVSAMVGPSIFGGNIGGKTARGGGRGRGGSRGRGRGDRGGKGGGRDDGLQAEGQYYDYEAHSIAYAIPRGQGLTNSSRSLISTSKILDAEDYNGNNTTRAERHRRRLAEQERERETAKKLASYGGKSAGGEYMRRQAERAAEKSKKDKASRREPSLQDSPDLDIETKLAPMDAASLGLIRKDVSSISLDPINGKRSALAGSATPMGWGGAFKRGLLDQMRDKEKEEKKKTAEARSEGDVRKAMLAAAADVETVAPRKRVREESSDDDLDIV